MASQSVFSSRLLQAQRLVVSDCYSSFSVSQCLRFEGKARTDNILGILFFAGTGALTAASRCTYAFARDGAIPGSRVWSRVDKRFDIPFWALVLSTVVDCLLGLIYFGSTAAFNSFTGVATICLSTSYGLPILVSVLRGRKMVAHSSFSLGRFGMAINVLTICWIALAVVLFSMPVTLPVDSSTMNYASVVFAGFAVISIVWYFVRGRKVFTGPPVPADVDVSSEVGVVKGQAIDPEDLEKSTSAVHKKLANEPTTTIM